jgi:hypothetical protein
LKTAFDNPVSKVSILQWFRTWVDQ